MTWINSGEKNTCLSGIGIEIEIEIGPPEIYHCISGSCRGHIGDCVHHRPVTDRYILVLQYSFTNELPTSENKL